MMKTLAKKRHRNRFKMFSAKQRNVLIFLQLKITFIEEAIWKEKTTSWNQISFVAASPPYHQKLVQSEALQ